MLSCCVLMIFVLISESIEGQRSKFRKWKEALWSNGLKVSLRKTKVMVSRGITKDRLSKTKLHLF